jgi:TPR repeat protein
MRFSSRLLFTALALTLLAVAPATAQQAAPLPALPGVVVPPAYDEFRSASIEALKAEADSGRAAAAFALAKALLPDATNPAGQVEGARYLEQAAEAGIIAAQLQFAGLLRAGSFGVTVDLDRAMAYLESAAATGDTASLTALGTLILDTQLGSTNLERAIGLLEEAAELGDINASNALGALYAQGRGVPLNPKKALEYYNLGLVAGNNNALIATADLLRLGSADVVAAPDKAMALYLAAASKGDRGAARKIADMNLKGEGLAANRTTAETMLAELGTSGDPAAYQALGDLYSRGEMIAVDIDKAIDYYQRSADAGNPAALVRLGDLYRFGATGLSPDMSRAVDFYNKAIDLGYAQARRTLAGLYMAADSPIADPERGVELLEAGAVAGDTQAAIQLGQLYSTNDVFAADYDRAKKYFELAIAQGNFAAAIRMGSAFAIGPLAATHSDEALSILTGAVESKIPGAATEMAKLQLAGAFPGVKLDGVISMLLETARAGDVTAARYLVQLYRDGYGLLLQPDAKAAAAMLANFEPLLGKEATAAERILLNAKDGRTQVALDSISADFQLLSRATGIQILRQLRGLNAQAYVRIVQEGLAALDIYKGALHGTLDSTTIRAIRTACEQAGAAQRCSGGPLTEDAVLVIGNFLFDKRQLAQAAAG